MPKSIFILSGRSEKESYKNNVFTAYLVYLLHLKLECVPGDISPNIMATSLVRMA